MQKRLLQRILMEQESVIKALLFECLEKKSQGHVLDLGCGDGTYTKFVADHIDYDVAGVEMETNNIRKCKQKGLFIREVDIHAFIKDTHAGHLIGSKIVHDNIDAPESIFPLHKQSFIMLDTLPYLGKHDVINTIKRMQDIGLTILIVVQQGIMEPNMSANPYEIVRSSWATHELERLEFSTILVEDFYESGLDAIFACWTTSDVAQDGWYAFQQLLKQESWG